MTVGQDSPAAQGKRRRLQPEGRRQEILDAARGLFAQRPLTQVTTTDVARAAGCSRALVHAYFGGIRELFLAVIAESGTALSEVRQAAPPIPLEERTRVNIPASLDVVQANREAWIAVVGHPASSGDAEIDALVEALTELGVQRSLEVHRDLIDDTPPTRAALRALLRLSNEVTRLWLAGQLTRDQAESFLIGTWNHSIRQVIPHIQNAATGPDRPRSPNLETTLE